jgi:hypothetical protein
MKNSENTGASSRLGKEKVSLELKNVTPKEIMSRGAERRVAFPNI